MTIIAKVLIALVALEHLYFLVLEMFLWTTPRTRAAFGMSAEQAEQTKVLAANQGLYNGFLAAGLAWSLLAPSAYARPLALFFLGCVLVAGIYGGFHGQQAHLAAAGAAGGAGAPGGHILVKSRHAALRTSPDRTIWGRLPPCPVSQAKGAYRRRP